MVKEAVMRFQEEMGLDVDGVAGAITRDALAYFMKYTLHPYSLRVWI